MEKAVRRELQEGRLGVIVGGGGYGQGLAIGLRAAGVVAREYSWTPFSGRRWLDPTDLDEVVMILEEEGITDLVHAGTFSATSILVGGQFLRRPLTLAQVLQTAMGMRHELILPFDSRLGAASIRLRTAPELFEKYRPIPGPMGAIMADQHELERLQRLKSIALKNLMERKPRVHLPQAVIFDDERAVLWERFGTDALCAHAQVIAKGSARRTLLKLLAPGTPSGLDPPTIGTHTVVVAKAASVDVIALDADHGLIIDRVLTASRADEASILLCGI